MIKESRECDKQDVLALWKSAYPTQNEDYLNFYFEQIYDQGVGIVQEQDEKIVSSLQMNYHTIHFHGKQLKVNYILGTSTLPDYRRRGHMRSLMESAIDESQHNCLFTLIKAFNPKVYNHFGFDTLYYRNAYTITKDMLHNVSLQHIQNRAEPKELLQLYRQFILRFEGSYIRDVSYYEILLKELSLGHKDLVVYRDKHHEITGYLIYQKRKQDVIVQEAIYMESAILKRLLKKAIGSEKELSLVVSSNERLEKIFPLAIPKKQPYMMVRMNNIALFNKLYNVHVKNVQEAFAMLKKPLWCHEYY